MVLPPNNTGSQSIIFIAIDIYGPMKKVKKAKSYMVHGPGNIIGIQDKKAFARKKRILGQGFSDAALREHEPKVLEHIKSFCEKVSDVEFESESRQWSTARKMTLWCKCRTADDRRPCVFFKGVWLLNI